MRPRPAELLLAALLLSGGPARALEIGAAAADRHATPVDGKPFALLDAARGHKAVVVMFLSTVCPYASYYEARFQAMFAPYETKGILFVAVYSNKTEPRDEVARHVKKRGFVFPVIKDEDLRIADSMGARHTPEVFVLDGDARLRYHGRIEGKEKSLRSPDLRNALDCMLAGAPVKTAEAKAFGCAIVR